MWALFAGDVLLSALILFVPGFLFVRSLRFPKTESLCLAPFASSLMVVLLCYAYSKIGVSASFVSLLLPIILFTFACFCLSGFLSRGGFISEAEESSSKVKWGTLAVYVIVAVCVAGYVFVKTLDGAGSFNQQYDNYSHLNAIRAFIDSGVYAYNGLLDYPFSWYSVAAMVAGLGSGEVAVAVNALNFVIVSMVWPASMCILLSYLFPSNRAVVLCGSLCSVAFVEFPWGLVAFGPLYPNMFAYSVLPAVMAAYASCFAVMPARVLITRALLFVLGSLSLVFMHPNSIFVGIVFLLPFTVSRIFSCGFPFRAKVIASVSFVVFVFFVWSALYSSAMFHGVVSFEWPAYLSGSEAIGGLLIYSLTKNSLPQIAMAMLVFVGCCICFVKRSNRWIVVSLTVSAAILVVASSSEGDLKHFLAGFWYTDTFRIASMVVIASIPLAAIGLNGVLDFVKNMALSLGWGEREKKASVLCLLIAISACIYLPNTQYAQTSFGNMRDLLGSFNSQAYGSVLEKAEIDFIEEANAVIPSGSRVENIPFDGSYLAYGVTGFKVVNTSLETPSYWKDGVDNEGKLIRSRLCDYAIDDEVKAAVEDQEIQYVLLLDKDDFAGERMDPCAKDLNAWRGIMSVTDETKGFEVVLAQGDMRLYRLTDV